MMKNGIIYFQLFDNGKGYIGQTRRSLSERLHGHKHAAAKGGSAVCRAWRKYGTPWCTVLGEYTLDELNAREVEAIALYGTLAPNGYNLEGGGNAAKSRSAETRAKMSEAQKGRPLSAETRAKLKGRTLSAEHRAKIGEANKGRTLSAETRAKMSKAKKGCTLSAETRAKIGEAMRRARKAAVSGLA